MFVTSTVTVPAWSRLVFVKRLRWLCSLLMVLGFVFSVALFFAAAAAWFLLGLLEISLYDRFCRFLFETISGALSDCHTKS